MFIKKGIFKFFIGNKRGYGAKICKLKIPIILCLRLLDLFRRIECRITNSNHKLTKEKVKIESERVKKKIQYSEHFFAL